METLNDLLLQKKQIENKIKELRKEEITCGDVRYKDYSHNDRKGTRFTNHVVSFYQKLNKRRSSRMYVLMNADTKEELLPLLNAFISDLTTLYERILKENE